MRLSSCCRSVFGGALLIHFACSLGAHSSSQAVAESNFAVSTRATPRSLDEVIALLPPPPAGVTDIRFNEFFRPIGDRGLEYSPKLHQLEGQRVRIAGFVVRQERSFPRLLLLTATPVSTHEIEYGFCDELPPATLHVLVSEPNGRTLRQLSGPVMLVGKLELGPRGEADGRNSTVRLVVDSLVPTPPIAPVAAH